MRTRAILSALLAATLGSCGIDPTPVVTRTAAEPPTTLEAVPVAPEPEPKATIAEPAEVEETAVRITAPATVEQHPPVNYDALADAEYVTYDCGRWAGEALAVGWSPLQIPKLLRTMRRESNCEPAIRSSTSDSGLMQVNDIVLRDARFRRDWPHFDPSSLFDPKVNLAVALWLWGIDGWRPWGGGA